MAITDAEKQEIIDALLTEIRANGLDYSGQTITFPDAFNVTQTERQNVKIPAIDERSATPVHGNVDLEALLTAYGVTHVEEIASDISSNYMKKVADSDLNMNGYDITNANVNVSTHMTVGSEGNSYGGYQITSSEELDAFVETGKVMFGKIIKDASPFNNDGIILSIGWRNHETRGYARQIFFDEMSHLAYDRSMAGGVWDDWMMLIGNVSSAVYAMGSNYIRWQNGLQICFGSFTKNVSLSTANGNVYTDRLSVEYLYPVSFTSVVHLSVTPSYNYIDGVYHNLWVGFNYTYTSKIHSIGISSPTPIDNTDLKFDFVAIGRWK